MVDELTTSELWSKIQEGDRVQIIDIRSEREFQEGHIPGAINIPFNRFAQEVENHDWDETIVVACPMGESSLQAARLLESYEGVTDGSRVINLAGGYSEWDYDLEQDL